MVEQRSNGSLKVDIFENNKLGAEQQFYTAVRNGTIEMALPGMTMGRRATNGSAGVAVYVP